MIPVNLKLDMQLKLVHKTTAKEYTIDSNIEKRIGSDDFEAMCDLYRDKIDIDEEKDKERFNSEVLKLAVQDMKEDAKQRIENIDKVVKEVFSGQAESGYISFGGALINIKDFCMIKVSKFDIRSSK